MRTTITTITGALCAAAALLPATAQAATEYRAEAFGTGTYVLDIDASRDRSTETSRVEAHFAWRTVLPSVHFTDSRRFSHLGAAPIEPTRLTGTLKRAIRVIDRDRPSSATVVDCKGAEVADPAVRSDALRSTDALPHGLVLTPFERVEFTDHGCSTGEGGPFDVFTDGGDPHGIWTTEHPHGEFDQVFDLPPEAVGAGKVVQLVKPQPGQVIPVQCPGYSQEQGERCTSKLEWSGQVVFTKIGETRDEGDDLIAPLVPPGPAPERDDSDLIAPLVPAKASVDRAGRTVSFRAGCAGGCTGTATITAGAGARAARAAATRRPLATLRFRVAAGAPRTVRLRLPAKARAALRRTRRATLAIALRPFRGDAVRRTSLRLALPRR